jgi:hypothetical protein
MSYRVRQYQNVTAQRKTSTDFYNALAAGNVATVSGGPPVAIDVPSLLPGGTITVPGGGYRGAGGFPIPGT